MSKLVYTFASLLEDQRTGVTKLDLPPEITDDMLNKFKDQSIDFRNFSENGNGMPFNVIADILNRNMDAVKKRETVSRVILVEKSVQQLEAIEDEDLSSDSLFLETFRSINSKRQCVYGICKDM